MIPLTPVPSIWRTTVPQGMTLSELGAPSILGSKFIYQTHFHHIQSPLTYQQTLMTDPTVQILKQQIQPYQHLIKLVLSNKFSTLSHARQDTQHYKLNLNKWEKKVRFDVYRSGVDSSSLIPSQHWKEKSDNTFLVLHWFL